MTVQTEAPSAPAPEAPAPEAPAQPAVPQQAQPAQQPARQPPGQPDGGQFAPPAPEQAAAPAEPDWKTQAETARAEVARLRTEAEQAAADAARWKQQSRQQEARSKANHQQVRGLEGVVRQIAEKLEIPYDDNPDPAEVSRKLAETTAEARQLRVERAIYLTAAKSGADANALLDSREFIGRTEQIDPEASDFADQVADLVREAARQAKYQLPAPPAPEPAVNGDRPQAQAPAQPPAAPAQPPAASSGADFSGAPGGNRLWTQADYDYWTQPGRDRDGSVMAKAIADGLLVNLGIGRPRRTSRR